MVPRSDPWAVVSARFLRIIRNVIMKIIISYRWATSVLRTNVCLEQISNSRKVPPFSLMSDRSRRNKEGWNTLPFFSHLTFLSSISASFPLFRKSCSFLSRGVALFLLDLGNRSPVGRMKTVSNLYTIVLKSALKEKITLMRVSKQFRKYKYLWENNRSKWRKMEEYHALCTPNRTLLCPTMLYGPIPFLPMPRHMHAECSNTCNGVP